MKSKDYENLKAEVEEATRDADKAEGALQQLMKDLKADHGCKTLEQAEAKLVALEKQQKKAKKAYEKALEAFNKKWEEREDEDDEELED